MKIIKKIINIITNIKKEYALTVPSYIYNRMECQTETLFYKRKQYHSMFSAIKLQEHEKDPFPLD